MRAAAVAPLVLIEPGADQRLAMERAGGLHHAGRIRLQFGKRHVGGHEPEAAFRQEPAEVLGRAPPETAEPLDFPVAGLHRLVEGRFEVPLGLPAESVELERYPWGAGRVLRQRGGSSAASPCVSAISPW